MNEKDRRQRISRYFLVRHHCVLFLPQLLADTIDWDSTHLRGLHHDQMSLRKRVLITQKTSYEILTSSR